MAQLDMSPSDLRKLASGLRDVAHRLDQIADDVEASEMGTVLLHISTLRNTYMREMNEWVDIWKARARSQIETFRENLPSRARIDKERYAKARQKKRDKKSRRA